MIGGPMLGSDSTCTTTCSTWLQLAGRSSAKTKPNSLRGAADAWRNGLTRPIQERPASDRPRRRRPLGHRRSDAAVGFIAAAFVSLSENICCGQPENLDYREQPNADESAIIHLQPNLLVCSVNGHGRMIGDRPMQQYGGHPIATSNAAV
jgi:hypothetical protein